jgi:hypothetical protein
MRRLRHSASVILAAIITLTSLAVPVTVLADGSNVSISPATLEVENGASFTVDVVIDTDTEIRGWQLDVQFDPAMVQCTGVTFGSFLQTWAAAHGASVLPMPFDIDSEQGTITGICAALLGANGSGPAGTGTLCTIAFTAQPDVDDFCDVIPVSVGLADIDAEPIPDVSVNPGVVAIGDAGERQSPPSPPDEPDGEDGEDRDLTLEQETSLAVDAAEYWLDRRASDTFPEFSGAELNAPLPCYDLEDRLICFRFAVEKSGETVGTMTIGSSLYDNAAFEVNDGYLPEPLSPSEVVAIAERDLDITARSPVSEQPEKLLYLGLLDTCAVYDVEGQKVAVSWESERGAHVSSLQMRITTPEQYAIHRQEGGRDGGRDFPNMKVLAVPDRDMTDDELGELANKKNCGPTSGAMIMSYYDEDRALDYGQVYPGLPNWPHDHNGLYVCMECNKDELHPGVWPESAFPDPGIPGAGWVYVAHSYGCSDFETSWEGSPFPGGVAYQAWDSTIVPNIDNLWPMMVMFWGGTPYEPGEDDFSWHWNALKGYEEDQGSEKYIWTNDPWHDVDERVLGWDIYCEHIHLTMVQDDCPGPQDPPDPPDPPTVGMSIVEVDKLGIVKAWFGKLMDSLVATLPSSQDGG